MMQDAAFEPVAIKDFHTEAWEGAEQLLNQLTHFALVMNILLLSPVFSSSKHLNPLYFLERGIYSWT